MATLAFVSSTTAQDAKPAQPPEPTTEQRPVVIPLGNLGMSTLRQLGLSDEQNHQIRKLNMANLRLRSAVRKQMSEAKRLLDNAIYADYADEADIQNKLQQLQQAQAEMDRLRYMNELAIRRILTQEQLVRFRELRQQYEDMRAERMKQMRLKFDQEFRNKKLPALPQRSVRPFREKPAL